MTQKEFDLKTDAIMKEFMTKITDAINDLRYCSVYGQISPLLQRLEEARFWLKRCIESHEDYLKQLHDEQEKKQEESSDKD